MKNHDYAGILPEVYLNMTKNQYSFPETVLFKLNVEEQVAVS